MGTSGATAIPTSFEPTPNMAVPGWHGASITNPAGYGDPAGQQTPTMDSSSQGNAQTPARNSQPKLHTRQHHEAHKPDPATKKPHRSNPRE